jgi:type IV secretory pathway VirB2 component (pilin)
MSGVTYWGDTPQVEGAEPLLAALQWLQGTALGTIATMIAIIAIAAIGILLLTGRIEWRRGVTTIIGCFVLFGAPAIASGILSAIGDGGASDAAPIVVTPVQAPPVPAPIVPPPPPPHHEPVL